jgi:hypothetical protein
MPDSLEKLDLLLLTVARARKVLSCSRALSAVNRRERPWFRPDIVGARANQLVVGSLLFDMRRPAGNPSQHKDGGEKRRRDPHEMVRTGREKICVGEQLLFLAHDLLDFFEPLLRALFLSLIRQT